jgi:hypothetical protein
LRRRRTRCSFPTDPFAHAGFRSPICTRGSKRAGDWNDPACLSDFTWTRAHPTARRSAEPLHAGSQFGRQDFADLLRGQTRLGRTVTHMVRGHDHVEDRYAINPAYRWSPPSRCHGACPASPSVPHVRVPTIARYIAGSLPQVHRLHVPESLVQTVFPEPSAAAESEPVVSEGCEA